MRITSAGNVGIGTTSPGENLAVSSSAGMTVVSINAIGGQSSRLLFKRANTNRTSITSDASDNIIFANESLAVERARIDSSGRLLVGTSTSRGNLFNGTGNDTNFQLEGTTYGGSSASFIRNSNTSGQSNADNDELQIGNNSSATKTGITLGSTDQSGIAFADASNARAGLIEYTHSIDSLRFYTNGASNERLRITNTGAFKFTNTGGYNSASGTANEINFGTSGQDALQIFQSGASPYGLNIYHTTSVNNGTNYFLFCSEIGTQRASPKLLLLKARSPLH
jgi:hypothetical protein